MRINKYVALCTGMSRRAADNVIAEGRVLINGVPPETGYQVTDTDAVTLDKHPLRPAVIQTVLFNKPPGYVVSRDGQGSQTIYTILPPELDNLKAVGRLDKDSSGLLILTNDGELANQLTHPSNQKLKIYEVTLDRALQPLHRQMIHDYGVQLEDGISKLQLERVSETDDINWIVKMTEGRNRQIRRTFWSLGYTVTRLHRTQFGPYQLRALKPGHTAPIS